MGVIAITAAATLVRAVRCRLFGGTVVADGKLVCVFKLLAGAGRPVLEDPFYCPCIGIECVFRE